MVKLKQNKNTRVIMFKNMQVVKKVEANNLPEKLKAARLKDGRSVQVLATYAEMSSAYWYQIENNQRDWVSEEIVRKMEKVLGVQLLDFKQPIAA